MVHDTGPLQFFGWASMGRVSGGPLSTLRLGKKGDTDCATYGGQPLVARPELRSGREQHRAQQVCVNRTQPPPPKPILIDERHDLGMAQLRELAQVPEKLQEHVALLDRSKSQFLDHQRVASDLIVRQMVHKAWLGPVKVVDPDRSIDQYHGVEAGAAVPLRPGNPTLQER